MTYVTEADLASTAAGKGAAMVGFAAAGTGAVDRTTLAKLREQWISVKDFGAAGDGSADDTAEINAAIAALNAGQTLYFPDGTYKVTVPDAGERALTPIPIGCNVFMEGGAWLTAPTSEDILTFFTLLGDNIVQVNVDGGSYPASGGVPGTWPNATFGIRCYYDEGHGLGASNVIVVDSEIKNVQTPVRADGASNWRICGNRFHRYKQSGVLLGYFEGRDCVRNIVSGNHFEDSGDTAVAFFQVGGLDPGHCAFNIVANNTARNYCQRTGGFAFDVEENPNGADYQRQILFIGNVAEQTIGTLDLQMGGCVFGSVSGGLMIGNVVRGGLGSSADHGYALFKCVGSLCVGNVAENFRGSGILIDGSIDTHAIGNKLTNCGGGNANANSITLALSLDSIHCSARDNVITVTEGHPYHPEGVAAISAVAASGMTIRDLTISGNVITAPLNLGIQVIGLSGAHAANIACQGNVLNGRASSDFFASYAFQIRYADQVTITDTSISNAGSGFAIRDCIGVTLGETELKGSVTLATLDYFAGSSGIKVRNRRCYQPVTTAIADAGTGTTWENDNIVKTYGYGTSASISSGGTIAHGLAFTPAFVSVTPAGAGPTGVSAAAGGSNITVTFGGGGSSAFFWEARV